MCGWVAKKNKYMKNKIENLCQNLCQPLASVFEAKIETFAKPLPKNTAKRQKTFAIAIAYMARVCLARVLPLPLISTI